MPVVTETGPSPSTTQPGGRRRVRVIQGPRWGSSGYYTNEALDSAARVLAPGVKIYLDHPGRTEERDRPERSLRDLVGKIAGPITREADGVYAVMETLPHWAEIVESLASDGDLDMSIRAIASTSPGEAEGKRGLIIGEFAEFLSVDLVTEAGAGGRVMELIESALAETPTRDTREQLATALTAAYQADVWVIDFDPDTGLVWFEGDGDRIWQHAFTESPLALTGSPVEVTRHITYRPINQEASVPTIDDAEYKRLTETAAKATQLETDLAEARQAAEKAKQEAADALKEAAAARAQEAEALIAASTLPAPAKDRIRETVKNTPDSDVAALIAAEADYLSKVTPTRPASFGGDMEASTATPTRSPWGRETRKDA